MRVQPVGTKASDELVALTAKTATGDVPIERVEVFLTHSARPESGRG